MKTRILFLPVTLVVILIMQSCAVKNPVWDYSSIGAALTKGAITGGSSWNDPVGFQAGVSLRVLKLSEPISIRAGANISLQGAKYEEDNGLKGRVDLLYINVPVVVRYQSQSGIYGEAGLQPGFLLSAKDKYSGITENYMDYMNKLDFSIPIEIGFAFRNSIGLGIRIIPGMNDITPDEDVKDRNFIVGIRGTYTFRIK